MSDAVFVHEAYKQFGNLYGPLWKRVPRINGKAIGGVSYNALKPVVAVDRVSFTVGQGEIFGILGPKGSGKSTLIRLLATLLLPDDGDIRVFGYDVVEQSAEVQRLINRVSVEASFFKKLSPMDNLVYGARLSGLSGPEVRSRIVEILTRLGLDQTAILQPMEEMSRSTQQKVAIARAMLTHPRLLLLDDPTCGIDPASKSAIHGVIRELRDQHGTTILFTTHDAREAESLCDRVAVLVRGKIVALDTPARLKGMAVQGGLTPSLEEVFRALAGKDPVRNC